MSAERRRQRLKAALEQKWHEDGWGYELRCYVRRLRRTMRVIRVS